MTHNQWLGSAVCLVVLALTVQGRLLGSGREVLNAGSVIQYSGPASGGQLVAWGNNDYNQSTIPSNLGFTPFLEVCAGFSHACARSAQGTVVCWGDSSDNRTAVPAGLSNVTSIACAGNSSYAVVNGNEIHTWGTPLFHAGGEEPVDITFPISVPDGITAISGSVSNEFILALFSNGTAGGFGSGANSGSFPPNGLADVEDVYAGYMHSLALLKNGTVVCWGDSQEGGCEGQPTDLTNATGIAAGVRWSAAALSNGSIVTFGPNAPAVPAAAESGVGKITAGAGLLVGIKPAGVGKTGMVVINGDNSTNDVPSSLFSPPQAVAAGWDFIVAIDAGSA